MKPFSSTPVPQKQGSGGATRNTSPICFLPQTRRAGREAQLACACQEPPGARPCQGAQTRGRPLAALNPGLPTGLSSCGGRGPPALCRHLRHRANHGGLCVSHSKSEKPFCPYCLSIVLLFVCNGFQCTTTFFREMVSARRESECVIWEGRNFGSLPSGK